MFKKTPNELYLATVFIWRESLMYLHGLCFIKLTNIEWTFLFNPFKPEFTIVIFIHYKPRMRNSRLVVDEDGLMWFKN